MVGIDEGGLRGRRTMVRNLRKRKAEGMESGRRIEMDILMDRILITNFATKLNFEEFSSLFLILIA